MSIFNNLNSFAKTGTKVTAESVKIPKIKYRKCIGKKEKAWSHINITNLSMEKLYKDKQMKIFYF